MYEAGLLSMGALAIILLAFGWAAWIFRGHRGDLSGLAIRREWWHRTETPPTPYEVKLGSYPTIINPEPHRMVIDNDGSVRTAQYGNRTHDARERGEDD